MARTITSILITGPAGNGKTTLAKLLKALISGKGSDGIIVAADMSDAIRWGLKAQGPLGDLVRSHEHLMKRGKNLPDDAIIPLFEAWFESLLKAFPRMQVFIGSGFPRSIPQIALLEAFDRTLVIHVKTTRDRSIASILERIDKTPPEERRADDQGGEEVARERWKEYLELTLPATDALGDIVLHLDRAQPLAERLELTLVKLRNLRENSPIPPNIVSRALARLQTSSHPIHADIAEIESPKPKEPARRSASPPPLAMAEAAA